MATIRIARKQDADRLPALERSAGEAFRQVPGLAWIADGEDRSVEFYRAVVARGTSWIAEVGGEAVGFLAAETFASELHVWEFAVRLDGQRRGHGSALFQAALAAARARRLGAITLTTFRDLAWNELLYRRLGFQTLDPERTGARLSDILAAEIARGLPGERRCAMRLEIAS